MFRKVLALALASAGVGIGLAFAYNRIPAVRNYVDNAALRILNQEEQE